MEVSSRQWQRFVEKLTKINDTATKKMLDWIEKNGIEDVDAMIQYCYALSTKYGEAASAYAAEYYDEVAIASGVNLPSAIPAETVSYSAVAIAMYGMLKTTQNSNAISRKCGVFCKQASADTLLQNAIRDKAEFAWIPSGDTCPFCMGIAAEGWQRAKLSTARSGTARHIHATCNCMFSVRFNKESGVAGYDPGTYQKQIDEVDGDLNEIRRIQYQENKDLINEQHRETYELRENEEETE